ncbi:MAG: hypothetical protein IPL62_13885 [Caulobacteraceae bacterium]|nr:hypothetical protein [Caulobacteraceae bacterium]
MLLRVLGGIALALGLLAAPAAAQTADVLAPARAGQLQCFEPNVTAKTCQSLGGYTFQANGVIDNPAQVLISPSPAIIMTINSPVAVRNNAICGPLAAADIQRATFTIDGAPAERNRHGRNSFAALTQQLAYDWSRDVSDGHARRRWISRLTPQWAACRNHSKRSACSGLAPMTAIASRPSPSGVRG